MQLSDAQPLKLMAFDIDGVMTDGRLHFAPDGSELKSFNSQDGLGIAFLHKAKLDIAIISGRAAPVVEARAANLGIKHVYQGVRDKKARLDELRVALKLEWRQVGFMGDDWVDLPPMQACGFVAAPANAHARVHAFVAQRAGLLCQAAGGRGAVREACEHILERQGLLSDLWAQFCPEEPALRRR